MLTLRDALTKTDRNKTLAAFWEEARVATTPLVEAVPNEPQYSWVTFLWQAKENTINVAIIDGIGSAVGGLDPAKALLTHLLGTDVWYRTYKIRNDAVFHYWLSPNDCLELLGGTGPRNCKPQADPLNPNRLGPVSYIELSAAKPRASSVNASVYLARGKVDRTRFHSELLANDRNVWVYTPPGHLSGGARLPLLITFDGAVFLDWMQVPTILDNLIAQRRVPPMVAVLVGAASGKRDTELACDKSFTEFLAKELVPWMSNEHDATQDPALTVVAGSSRGGLASAFAAYEHPEVFGNVLSQSGSYWWSPPEETERSWLTRQFVRGPLKNVRFSISAGLMEVPDQLDTNRHLRDVLLAKGYNVDYAEFNGNHSYVAWRADFGDRLSALLGSRR